MTVTITREQRDAIYQEVLTDLSGVGDIWVAIEHENYEEARESRRRFELDMLLLDDLGWDRVDDRKTFALSMPAARLAEVVRHLNANAGSELRHHINRPFEERELAERSLVASGAYTDVLAQLAAESGEQAACG